MSFERLGEIIIWPPGWIQLSVQYYQHQGERSGRSTTNLKEADDHASKAVTAQSRICCVIQTSLGHKCLQDQDERTHGRHLFQVRIDNVDRRETIHVIEAYVDGKGT